MIPHVWGVAGLVINTAAAFGLLYFRSNPFADSSLTADQLFSVAREHYWKYRREMLGYRVSVGAMAVGFILQLIDLLIA